MNTLEFIKTYLPLLDEVYKLGSKTAILDSDGGLVKAGANANEILIPKYDMDGMADYSTSSGYEAGGITLTYQTKSCDYDRGRKFFVDAVENLDTAGVAFGSLAGEFIRTKVVPELDTYRLSKYAELNGIGSAEGTLTTGKEILVALQAAIGQMDEDEVPAELRYLYITPTQFHLINNVDSNISRAILESFSGIINMPQSRMKKGIELVKGGIDTTDALDINFMVISKPSIIQFTKHVAPKVVEPSANTEADGWMFGYRLVGLNEAYDNKVKGIYVHNKAAI